MCGFSDDVGGGCVVRVWHGRWEVIHQECAPVLGGSAMDAEVKECGLLVERIIRSPEFAGVPPRAPARRRCVRVGPREVKTNTN